jgi:FtsP/CotA-like multicopper oxidase with cupredoxin domain
LSNSVFAQYSYNPPPKVPQTPPDFQKSTTQENQKPSTTMNEDKMANSEHAKKLESPKAQMIHGVSAQDVKCREGFQLVIKSSDNSPACIKPASVSKLMSWGWIKSVAADTQAKVQKLQVSVIEEDEVYSWTSGEQINPTLTLIKNTENVIEIQNPTDVKHEFVIESNGEEIAASGDISPDSSGMLSIKPDMVGELGYHCEYHPDSMKGTIQIIDS